MQRARVIPVLSFINDKLVNTIRFKKPRYIGDPINTIKILNEKLVDEIVLLDIRASLNNTNPNYQLIEDMASECFMPLSYGGGISNFDQAKMIFSLGVEKVILNSSCYSKFELIEEIASVYGSQSVVVSMDYKTNFWGEIIFTSHSSKNQHKIDFQSHVSNLEKYGMGELFLTSIDNEGSFKGLDKTFSKYIKAVNVPVIINGGLSCIEDMAEAFQNSFNAVAGTSFFVYRKNNVNSILISYPNTDIIKNLKRNERV